VVAPSDIDGLPDDLKQLIVKLLAIQPRVSVEEQVLKAAVALGCRFKTDTKIS